MQTHEVFFFCGKIVMHCNGVSLKSREGQVLNAKLIQHEGRKLGFGGDEYDYR
jgi:hypothetical protein